MLLRGIFLFLFLLSAVDAESRGAKPPGEEPSPTPTSMASLGDSITAGALAEYSIGTWKNPFEFLKIISLLVDAYARNDLSEFEARELAWATGHAEKSIVNSHAKRLATLSRSWRAKRDISFMAYNGAHSGKTSLEVLDEQVEPLLNWSQKHLKQGAPDYVTLLVGANDLCASKDEIPTSAKDFELAIRAIVSRITDANPQTEILISEIPNITHLWDAYRDLPVSRMPGARTCQDVWRTVKFCDNFLSDDESARVKASKQLQKFNAILADVVSDYAGEGRRLRLAENVYEHRIDGGDLSVDCFHPTEDGQKKIADVTWESTSWSHLID